MNTTFFLHARQVIPGFLLMFPAVGNAWAASEGGGGGLGPQFLWQVLSFIVLVVVLSILLKKPMRAFLLKRQGDIRNILEQSAKKRAESQGYFAEWDRKLNVMNREIEALHASIAQEGESERKRIIGRAQEEGERIRKQAEIIAEQEVKKARLALKKEMVNLSVELAEKLLRESIQPNDQERLVKEYIGKVRELR